MKTVLWVCGTSQFEYFDLFVQECNTHKDVRIVVFDPALYPETCTLSCGMDEHGAVHGTASVYDCSQPGAPLVPIDLTQVDVAWLIRKRQVVPSRELSKTQFAVAVREAEGAVASLLALFDWKWINPSHFADRMRSIKLFQQRIAQQVGLRTPPTLMTNDPDVAYAFAREHGHAMLKTIGSNYIPEKQRSVYTCVKTPKRIMADNAQVRDCPIFLQREIVKRYEHRCVIVGDQVLTCRIDSQKHDEARHDYRHLVGIEHLRQALPKKIENKLRQLARKLSLQYCVIDLVEDIDGEFWFLDCNPEDLNELILVDAGLPIAQAMHVLFLNI